VFNARHKPNLALRRKNTQYLHICPFSVEIRKKIALVIDSLQTNPRPHGGKKLTDAGLWRVRVGQYRIIYYIEERTKIVTVVKIATMKVPTNRYITDTKSPPSQKLHRR
jgi:mRNA-degrading endonuclease RelE of RelBE toxin-antitoxin system